MYWSKVEQRLVTCVFTVETQDEGLPRESVLVTYLIVFVLVRIDQFSLVFSIRNEQKNCIYMYGYS